MDLLLFLRGGLVWLLTDPRFLAALFSFVMSLLLEETLKKAFTCAVLAWGITPMVVWYFDAPKFIAPGIGLIIAIVGIHGIVRWARPKNIKVLIEAIKKARQ